MKHRNILIFLTLAVISIACNTQLPCYDKAYKNDKDNFIASGDAESRNEQMASDKALFDAKIRLSKTVNQYIDDTYNHPTVAPDPAYFKKLESSKKTVLKDIEILCNKTSIKKGVYHNFISIKISKEQVDNHVKQILKQTIR